MTTFEQFKSDLEADLLKTAMSEGHPDVVTWKSAMAAEWEAMLGDVDDDDMLGGGGGRESTRVLNQDEIDTLLGFYEEDYREPQPPKKWNDWRGQWAWMQKISMGFTIQPFNWEWEAHGPQQHGTMRIFLGPFIFRLHWPWFETWD